MDINGIRAPIVAIVQLHDGTQNPAVLFQVTIDPKLVSPSETHIRFGQQGDEILGWKRIDAIEVVEVLAEWDGADFQKVPKHTADVHEIANQVA